MKKPLRSLLTPVPLWLPIFIIVFVALPAWYDFALLVIVLIGLWIAGGQR